MAEAIVIPKVGMTMSEATVVAWQVDHGAEVEAGAPVLTIETDKAEVEVDASIAGIVHHEVEAGATLAAGERIGWLLEPGDPVPGGGGPASSAGPSARSGASGTPTSVTGAGDRSPAGTGERLFATPNARRIAGERGITLDSVVGTGPNGRILSEDVEEAAASDAGGREVADGERSAAPTGPRATPAARLTARRFGIDLDDVGSEATDTITRRDVERAIASSLGAAPRADAEPEVGRRGGDRSIDLSPMRKTIARRMMDSLSTSAQLTLTVEVRADRLEALRSMLRDEWSAFDRTVPTVNDLVLRAVIEALGAHPLMNARIDGDRLVVSEGIQLGVAVAVDDGLLVPVLHDADRMSTEGLAEAMRDLAARARLGQLRSHELGPSTFTVSNLGGEGVDVFTPILNPPNVGILGVGRRRDVVSRGPDGSLEGARALTLSLTWDHRAFDGVPAARFAATVRQRLEAPTSLL